MATPALAWVPGRYAVCRLDPGHGLPVWCVHSEPILAMVRTPDELTIVCEERLVPAEVRAERGFSALRVAGTIDFSATGILSSIAGPLAGHGVSVFALSTYDTDYLLVRAVEADRTARTLSAAGFAIS